MSRSPRTLRRARSSAALAVTTVLLVSGCALTRDAGSQSADPTPQGVQGQAQQSVATISANVRRGARAVDLDRTLRLSVADGTLRDVVVTVGGGGRLAGRMDDAEIGWRSTEPLRQDTEYRVRGTAVDAAGVASSYRSRFHTRTLSLDEQTYPSFVGDGTTVGVGMPAIIRFDIPVTDRASIERNVDVRSSPRQAGSFHWISDTELHWRPKTYWKPGTEVTVDAEVGGVSAGNGIYGQTDRTVGFTVGDAMVSKVDMDTHQMQVFRNGELIRTIPITTGEQPKFTTRTGTKVIMEKFESRRMSSETTGIPVDSADGYDIDDVQFAMRLTYSGEFIHAAPWSVGSQGSANVSHGCTGMSTADAGWLYENSRIGDVVEYTGSDRPMTLENGYGDWNLPFPDYRAGSSL